MDEDGLPIVGSGVDLTKVPAIQQRRIVAFLNQFIVHTVRFLNNFSTVCEEKLANISLRIQQIETTLCILEAKLSSIPGLEDVTVDAVGHPRGVQINGTAASDQGPTGSPQAVTLPPPEVQTSIPLWIHAICCFWQGVPVMAIRNKMSMEGLDPDLLE
uniref:WASH complex subunit 3 n=1 Tax=Hippocampus comes TaxID=109280 RepID=A0A3Q2Z3V7_HIPCM